MNPISNLQQQFPLSSRKFWKKMIEKLSAWYILVSMGLIIDVIILVMTRDARDPVGNIILWSGLLLGILFLVVITIVYGFYVKTYIKRYYYAGEDHFITIKKGVFAPAEIHVQWQKIQDVYVDQDILDRIMGLYDVHIASATVASGIEAHIDGVEQSAAEGLKVILLNKVSGAGRNSNPDTNISADIATNIEQSQQVPPKITSINLSEEISDKKYPLLGKWVAMKLVSKCISPFIYWAVIIFFLSFNIGKDIPPAYYWIYFLGYIGVALLNVIINIVSLFLWKSNYAYNFMPDNIYYRGGVISLSEKHMPYSSIQDVTVQQGVLERMFGLAKVRIENAAQQTVQTSRGRTIPVFTGVMLEGLSLEDANKITNTLKVTVLGKNTSQYGL